MATYIVGDVHGCFETLQALLQKIEWRPERDRVFLTGDLVNGGPDSLAVVRWARESCQGVVLGNHDLHLLAVAAGARPGRDADTFDDLLAAPDREELLRWLGERPLVILEPDFLLVHAGLLSQWGPEKARELAAEVEGVLRSDGAGSFLQRMYGNEPGRWEESLSGPDRLRVVVNAMTRMRMVTRDGCIDLHEKGPPEKAPAGLAPWYEEWRRRWSGRQVFFGHWAALGLRRMDPVVALDSGCAWGGWLSAIRLEDGKLFQAKSELAGERVAGS